MNDDERRRALLAFVDVGQPAPATKALVVQALADARRSVAALQARGEPIDDWLTGQIRQHGITEAAAFVAALELADRRQEVAQWYRQIHPDRAYLLEEFLDTLT